MDIEDLKLPTLTGSPTSEHGQMMFAMGQMVAQIKGLKDAQITANGRTSKNEVSITELKTWQNLSDGKESGISASWLLGFTILNAVGVIAAIYLGIKNG